MTAASPIEVSVKPHYLDEQSDPEHNRYVFAYTVTITNNGDEAATLESRHWLIIDGDEKVQEVRGSGVIGEQPTIAPGDHYEYSSGAVLETATGTMEGSYQMISESGDKFEAPIAMFSLTHPSALH